MNHSVYNGSLGTWPQPSDDCGTLLLFKSPLLISLAPSSHFPLPVPFLPIQTPSPHLTAISAGKCLWNVHCSKVISWFAVCNSWEDRSHINNQVPSAVEMIILVHLSLYKHISRGLMSPTCTGGYVKLQMKFRGRCQGSQSLATCELKPADTAAQLKTQPQLLPENVPGLWVTS